MTDFSIDTLRSIYITNQPYQYPIPWMKKKATGNDTFAGDYMSTINTGWHIIPNLLWGHVCNPKQWHEMMIKYEAIKVNSIHCRIFNPIPIQTAVSFQGNATFPAFNNTVYALGYTDEFYETPWFNWKANLYNKDAETNIYYQFNPAYKEGIVPKPRDKFDNPDAPPDLESYDLSWRTYPRTFTSQTTKEVPLYLQQNTYKRQFLPIYWYSLGFGQYLKTVNVGSYLSESSDFELAQTDLSGMFWDPLNQPHLLKELRPGKNMIEFSWNAHPVDSNIWFNTDRIALLAPYKRPSQDVQATWGSQNPWKPRSIDPRGVNYQRARDFGYLKYLGLCKEKDPITVPLDRMAAEKFDAIADWRKWPVVPMRWFFKEMHETNPWVFENFKLFWSTTDQACGAGMQPNDVELTQPIEDFRQPGTEYEMYKYPPSQWFVKAVPLFDDNETWIKVEMQAFMLITVNLTGKARRSAIYGPTWGPITAPNMYSVNMDMAFQENYMRGRSGGARRTWFQAKDAPPVQPLDPKDYNMFSSTGGEQGTVPFAPKKWCTPSGNRGNTPWTYPRQYYLKTAFTIDSKGKRRCINYPEDESDVYAELDE